MNIVNNETIKALGKSHASVALDQGEEFGSVSLTIQAYRENLSDTLAEQGLLEGEWLALDAYDRHTAQA
jgi:hypothetical protein